MSFAGQFANIVMITPPQIYPRQGLKLPSPAERGWGEVSRANNKSFVRITQILRRYNA